MNSYQFEFPYIFILIPFIWFCFRKCPARSLSIYFPYIDVLVGSKAARNLWLELSKWLGIILLVTALASPVTVTTYKNVQHNARDIMIILDSSTSMLERGFDNSSLLRDKFSVVVDAVKSFIKDRKNDRVGIITFADIAYIASPITYDKKFLQTVLSKQKVGIAGKKTALYDALLQSIYMLENSQAKSKIAIVLTDGADTASSTKYEDILKFIKKSKVKLYIIGVGQKDGLDMKKLKEMASVSKGKLYLAENKSVLKNIYKEIDKSETSKVKTISYEKYKYYYNYPLVFSIIFLLIYIYFKSIRAIVK